MAIRTRGMRKNKGMIPRCWFFRFAFILIVLALLWLLSNRVKRKRVEAFLDEVDVFRPGPVVGVSGDVDEVTVFDGDDIGLMGEKPSLTEYLFDVLVVVFEKGIIFEEMGGITFDGDGFIGNKFMVDGKGAEIFLGPGNLAGKVELG